MLSSKLRLVTLFTIFTCPQFAVSAPIISDGLIGYWAFEGNADDSSGNNIHGMTHGDVDFLSTGIQGNAATFDGDEDWISTSNFSDTWNNWSTSFFVNASNTTSGYQTIVERERIGQFNDLEVGLRPSGKLYIETDVSSHGTQISTNSLSSSKWQHVAVTYDGSKQNIYIDGVLDQSVSQSNAHVNINEGLLIGKHANVNHPQYFDGKLDELGIYNRALSESEIGLINNAGGGLSKRNNNFSDTLISKTRTEANGHLEILAGPTFTDDSFKRISEDNINLFKKDAPTYVVVHGWHRGEVTDPNEAVRIEVQNLGNRIKERVGENSNVLLYNWEFDAQSGADGGILKNITCAGYTTVTPGLSYNDCVDGLSYFDVPDGNVGKHAMNLSQSLATVMDEVGFSSDGEIHLIGDSLGAGVVAESIRSNITEGIGSKYADNIERVTLFDAPDNARALLSGAALGLDDALEDFRTNVNEDGFVENYIAADGTIHRNWGRSYDNAVNIYLNNKNHSFGTGNEFDGVVNWYDGTISPETRVENAFDIPDARIAGFNDGLAGGFYTHGEEYQNQWRIDGLENKEFKIVTGKDGLFPSPEFNIADISNITDISPNRGIGNAWYAEGADSGIDIFAGTMYAESNSPAYIFSTLDFGLDDFGISFDFMVSSITEDDYFIAAIDDIILFQLSGFQIKAGEWLTSGLIDISSFAGKTGTITFGLITDLSGQVLNIRDVQLYSFAAVPEPSTLILMGLGLVGLGFSRRRQSH